MMIRFTLAVIGCLLPLSLAAAPGAPDRAAPAAEDASPLQVVARAGMHDEFGRIVFDWPRQVGYKAEISGASLKIEFDHAMKTVLGSVRRNLSDYIGRITVAPDGRSITATLNGSYTVRSFTRGNRIVIDLLHQVDDGASVTEIDVAAALAADASGEPHSESADAARPTPLRRRNAAEQRQVADDKVGPALVLVRSGRHAGYGRLVFEWPGRVDYKLDRKGENLTVRFSRPANIDEARLRRILPPQIASVKAGSGKNGLRLSFGIAKGAHLRHFRDGNSVVLDIIGAAAAKSRDGGVARAPLVTKVAKTAKTAKADGTAETAKTAKTVETAKADGKAETAKADGKKPTLQAKPKASPAGLAPVRLHGRKSLSQRARERARKRRIDRAKKQQSAPGALVTVDATLRGTEISIRFNWREETAAAVYRRGNVLWIVFNRPQRIDLSSVILTGKAIFETAEQLSIPDASVLRLAMSNPYEIAVKRDKFAWIVDVGPKLKPPGRAVPVEVEYGGASGTQVALKASGVERIIRLYDPDVGDLTYVFPLMTPSMGHPTKRSYLDFEIMPSIQGLAIRLVAEAVSIRTAKDRLTVIRRGGLRITRKLDLAKWHPPKKNKIFDFASWRIAPSDKYQEVEHKLIGRITSTHGLLRNAARLSLSRFYVAHGMGAEALGVLRALLKETPTVIRDFKVRALRGVAAYQLRHYAEAIADLEHPALKRNPEVHPWLAGIAAARGDWAGAYRWFKDTDMVIKSYPPEMASQFAILAAEASLSVEDDDTGASRLSELEGSLLTEAQVDHVAYLRGFLAKKLGNIPRALALWDAVAVMGDRPSRAKAAYAQITTQLDRGDIKPKEAIEKLGALRFAWRDDVFEFDLLHRLGQLHAEVKDYRKALLTMRRAATYYSHIKGSQGLTAEMSDMFRKFYTDGHADKRPPISALGIYMEFRELTPAGEEGDMLITRLANRLEKIDLLAQAGELLEHQISFRLKGQAKAEAGTRLARIWIMDRQPEKALQALEKSEMPDLPLSIVSERKTVKAVALSKQGKFDAALSMISESDSNEADRLRADILWEAKRWRQASRILARLTGGFDQNKLNDDAARLLLRRAVALALSKDQVGVEFLRARFAKAMEKSRYAKSFKAVVGRKKVETDDYRVLARAASELDVFVAFRRSDKAEQRKLSPAFN